MLDINRTFSAASQVDRPPLSTTGERLLNVLSVLRDDQPRVARNNSCRADPPTTPLPSIGGMQNPGTHSIRLLPQRLD